MIANVTVSSGTITVTSEGITPQYVGVISGYATGNIYNCTVTNVVVNSTEAQNVGGIAGAIENTATTGDPIKVQYCQVTGNITGASRVGGIVGATYYTTAGMTIVDRSSYTGSTLTTSGTSNRSYVGGVVGYCQGWISYSYCLTRVK
jgi:hypothetical protein